jgi:hypothetical protein
VIKEIEEDPSIGQMTKVLYIKSQPEWLGVDQNIEDIDYDLYEELKSFLHSYFCMSQEELIEEEKWCSSIENGLTRHTNMVNPSSMMGKPQYNSGSSGY